MADVASMSAHGDDWSAVQDTATRRRIQNRIAQRAHRLKYGRQPKTKKGYRAAQRDAQEELILDEATSSLDDVPQSSSRVNIIGDTFVPEFPKDSTNIDFSFLDSLDYQTIHLRAESFGETLRDTETDTNSRPESVIPYSEFVSHQRKVTNRKFQAPSPLTDHLLVVRALGTLSALLLNASVLQIDCNTIRSPKINIPSYLITPSTLAPTRLQTITPHLPYVDLIPFPSIRDKLLLSQHIINGVEIWGDITRDVKVWGSTPWDDQGWEVSERFAVKWWFLMDDEVLRTTNFWRGTRDEKRLSVDEIKVTLYGGVIMGHDLGS